MSPPRRRPELVAVVLTNLLPVLGVAVMEWSMASVVLLYWFELGVMLAYASIRALFAQLPPQHPGDGLVIGATRHKRGGLSIPLTDLVVQVAHVPVIGLGVPMFGLVWLFTGGIGFAGLEAAGVTLADENAAVGFAIIGVVLGRGVETLYGYFLEGRHREVNAQMALQSAIWPVIAVGMALVAGGMGVAAGAPAGLLLACVVGAKLCFDLAGVYRDRLEAFDEQTAIAFGWANEAPEWPAIDETQTQPVDVVRPRPAGVLADGVRRGLTSSVVGLPLFMGALGVLLALATGSTVVLAWFGGGAMVILIIQALLGLIDRAIRYLTMEYRFGRDVVGYDRLLGEPQWRLPGWKVHAAERRRSRLDRALGTATVVVDRDDRTVRLPALPVDELLDGIERPTESESGDVGDVDDIA